MAFKTKDIGHQKIKNPGICATNEVSPGTAQLLSWENVQALVQGGETRQGLLGRRDWTHEYRDIDGRVPEKRELNKQRQSSWDSQRVCLEYLTGSWPTNTWEENTKGQEKITWKD